ncbi:MAG: hypothetical protein FVQ77_14725 [Cytophagales bacterium]|nr:hypothetical protein [Cytophagales bacterium]
MRDLILQEIEKNRMANSILSGILAGIIVGIPTGNAVGILIGTVSGILAGIFVAIIISNSVGTVLRPAVALVVVVLVGVIAGMLVVNKLDSVISEVMGTIFGIIAGIISPFLYIFLTVILNKLLEKTEGKASISKYTNIALIFTLKRNKLLSYLFFPFILLICCYLIYIIIKPIQEQKLIEAIEEKVIDKLKLIRDAQIAYMSVNGEYAERWDKLIDFVKNGNFYITERKERIITFTYGADSIVVEKDTLAVVPVRDSLFSKEKYPDFDPVTLLLIPESSGKKFDIFADRISKSGVLVEVFEVRDSDPVNPKRRRNNSENALKIGSMTDVTTSGNWE